MKINRTALAAAASITAVVLAGTAALAANFGILSSTDDGIDSSITPTVVSSTPPPENSDGAASAPELFAYQVDGVGVVTLERLGETLELSSVDVDGSMWSWSEGEDEDDDEVAIRFTSDTAVVSFLAALEDGQIIVDVVDETPIGDDHDSGMVGDDDESEHEDEASEREDDSRSVEDDD